MMVRPTLVLVAMASFCACNDYSQKRDGKSPGQDARSGPEARIVDRGPPEPAPLPRDQAAEARVEAGPSPDRCGTPATCPVVFVYDKGSESKVDLFGSFNNWSSGVPMTLVGSQWRASVSLNHGQQIQYKFVLDSKTWVKDPKNPVDSGPPNHNSVLDVLCPTFCPG